MFDMINYKLMTNQTEYGNYNFMSQTTSDRNDIYRNGNLG